MQALAIESPVTVSDETTYTTILGRNPSEPLQNQKPVVVELILPHKYENALEGEYGFKWIFADLIQKTYFHYGFRLHPKGAAVNVHVFGERALIERFAKNGAFVRCELELVEKSVGERTFILVNLYITKNPNRRVTHDFGITSKSPKKLEAGEYTTPHMKGMTIGVFPLTQAH